MNEKTAPELPQGWVSTSLGEALEIIRGISFPKDAKIKEFRDGYTACLRTANVQKEVDWDDLWFVPQEYMKRKEQSIHLFDILISTANSLYLVGKVAQVKHIPFPATLGAFISLIRVPSKLNPKYFYFQLSSFEIQSNIRKTASTTTNISNISIKKLSGTKLKISPLAEQHRIVTRIEELFTQLDAGVESLKKTQAQLKQYRQSVLKSACEGKLVPTEAELARAEGREYEPADVLLERVLKERRENWEAEQIRKGKKSAKYKEPAAPDVSGFGKLPEGWTLSNIGQVAECLDHMRIPVNKKERAKRVGDVPYYGANGQVDWINDYLFEEPLILIVEDETFVGREKPFCYKITGKSWVNNREYPITSQNPHF